MTLPLIPELDILPETQDDFKKLFDWIDRDETQLVGLVNDKDEIFVPQFPVTELNYLLNLQYVEVVECNDKRVEALLWELQEVTTRFNLLCNRHDRALSWIESRLSKCLTLVDPLLLKDHWQRIDKLQYLGNNVPVVGYLLEQHEKYSQMKLKMNGLAKVLDRLYLLLSFRIQRLDQEGDTDNAK